jgi:hypothetical protein
MKGACSPNKALDTVDDMTNAQSGLNTVSIAKKHPATAVETYRHSKTSEGCNQEKIVA